jgi:hypothetical protein
MIPKIYIVYFLFFGTLLFFGCSQKTVKFGGTVKFSDGSPVTLGTVNFDSGTHTFLGHIDANGHYAPGMTQQGGGIPEGLYQVWLTGTDKVNNVTNPDGTISQQDSAPYVAEKFCKKETSGLTFEVKSGEPKTFDIVVEKPKN